MNQAQLFLKSVGKGMKQFGENITALINTLLLLMVYFIGVGVTALIARFIRKQFLDQKTSKEAKSYWSDLHITTEEQKKYYRQF